MRARLSDDLIVQLPPNARLLRCCRLLCLLWLLIPLSASAQSVPQISQGSGISFAPNGTNAPASGSVWSIVRAGSTIATNKAPNSWQVFFSVPGHSGQFTVYAPPSALIATGYNVRWDTGASSNRYKAADFSVSTYNKAIWLEGLTLTPTGLYGGANLTGQVKLNASAPGDGIIVSLKNTSSTLGVPQSVIVPSGATTATFTVTSNATASTQYVTVTAENGGWKQANTVTVLPAATTLTVQDLTIDSGNGCIILDWVDLPRGSIKGYNVYRYNGTTPVLLNAQPIGSAIYADTGLTNGATYQYQVRVVGVDGTEINASSPVSAAPSASKPSMSWVNPPASVSGVTSLYTTTTIGNDLTALLIVDGRIANGSNEDGNLVVQEPAPHSIEALLYTDGLKNGTHTVQMIGWDENNKYASPPITVQVNNTFGNFSYTQVFDPSQNEMMAVDATAPANTTQWTTQILDDSSTVVRSWTGTNSVIHLSWDANNAAGAPVPDGDYTVLLTAIDSSGTSRSVSGPLSFIRVDAPQMLALLDTMDLRFPQYDRYYRQNIKGYFAQMAPKAGYSFRVLLGNGAQDDNAPIGVTLALRLRKYLRDSVVDFYSYSHGGVRKRNPTTGKVTRPRYFRFSGIYFYASAPDNTDDQSKNQRTFITHHSDLNIVVPDTTNFRPYSFAFVDACHSAGNGAINTINVLGITRELPGFIVGTPSDDFAIAFNIGIMPEIPSLFIGWNGAMLANSCVDVNGNDASWSYWYDWRTKFWQSMVAGYYVSQALFFANSITDTRYGTGSVIKPMDYDPNGVYTRQTTYYPPDDVSLP